MQYLKFLIKKSSFVALSVIVLSFAGCSKGGESPAPTPTPPPVVITESDIAFKVDVAGTEVNYSNVFAVVGTSVQMNANITSSLPKDGVTIDISVKKKLDNAVVFSSNLSSSGAYSQTLQTVNGCDSIVNLNLTGFPFILAGVKFLRFLTAFIAVVLNPFPSSTSLII